MVMNITSDGFIKKVIPFMEAAISACKKAGKDYTFTCPNCGGEAHVYMVKSNRHRHGYCDGCKISFAEQPTTGKW